LIWWGGVKDSPLMNSRTHKISVPLDVGKNRKQAPLLARIAMMLDQEVTAGWFDLS
jgi:hypothetical protein